MASEAGTKTIFAAAGANVGIAAAKFVAGSISGSSAMISEAVHSIVDTGNEALLYVGLRASKRPPDDLHPFGHGRDLYFFTLLVAMMIFAGGGGAAIYEGAQRLMYPEKLRSPLANFIVLGIAMVLEGASFTIAAREFEKNRPPNVDRLTAFRASKDPSVFAVMYEDGAALLGLTVAFIGTALDTVFDASIFDAIASLTIGAILVVVAILLTVEARGLLVGERATRGVIRQVRTLAASDPAIDEILAVLTMQLAPREVLLILTVRFRRGLSLGELGGALDRVDRKIREEAPDVTRVFIDIEDLAARAEG